MKHIEKEINLRKKGKRFLIISGTHGDESNAVKAVYNLYKSFNLEPKALTKKLPFVSSIKFIIGLNESGLLEDDREFQKTKSLDDVYDLNRSFKKELPVKKSEIVEYVKSAVDNADVVIDVHNSFYCIPCTLVDYDGYASYMLKTLKPVTKLKHIVRAANANAATIKSFVNSFETKLGYTIELPYMGFHTKSSFEYEVNILQDLIFNLNIPKEIKKTADFKSKYVLPVEIIPRLSGIIYWTKRNPVAHYNKGDAIAYIDDGNNVEWVYAPESGTIIDIGRSYIVTKGDGIAEMVPDGTE